MTQTEILLLGSLAGVEQCLSVLSCLDDVQLSLAGPAQGSVGAHLRHVLERYLSLVNGIANGRIDYDLRPRNRALESSVEQAQLAFAVLADQVRTLHALTPDLPLTIVETVHEACGPVLTRSTLARELMSLAAHTTHHLAIIRLLLNDLAIRLPASLGKAPSTLRFERGCVNT